MWDALGSHSRSFEGSTATPPVPDLNGVLAKIGRAEYHIDCLRHETATFLSREPCPWRSRVESKPAGDHCIRYCLYAVITEGPPPDWAIIAGDALHNLRSATDHLLRALMRPTSAQGGYIKFPIHVDECEFRVRAKGTMKRLEPVHRAFIQELQPYHWDEVKRPHHPLVTLQKLSNLDKHESLIPTAISVGVEYIALTNVVDPLKHEWATNRPLRHNAKIRQFVACPVDPTLPMKVDPRAAFQVSLEGEPVGRSLEEALGFIASMLRSWIDMYFGFGVLPNGPF